LIEFSINFQHISEFQKFQTRQVTQARAQMLEEMNDQCD
jgi:hypothetical protein